MLKTNFKKDDSVFNLSDEIKKLEDSDRRDLNIIALYLIRKGIELRNREQLQAAIVRNIRIAQQLMVFEDDQLISGMESAQKEHPDIWTLSTCLKMIIP